MNRPAKLVSGFLASLVALVVLAAGVTAIALLAQSNAPNSASIILIVGVTVIVFVSIASGLVVVDPNQAVVIQFFGRYRGTVAEAGFWCTIPFSSKRKLSKRVRNFETAQSKVNDSDGNPVEIAAVIVWRVTDPAKAVFAVDNYISYVSIQSETALRHLATCYPYDTHDTGRMSLRDGAQVSEELTQELRERIDVAGIEVIESRITHLAYSPEIAQVMLRRQQASAVVAARSQIVEGAVGMVHTALDRIAERELVALDDERKATMVSNLMVVLCSDQATQPVVNTGSLYS